MTLPIVSLETMVTIFLVSWIAVPFVLFLRSAFTTRHRWKHRTLFVCAAIMGLTAFYGLLILGYARESDPYRGWVILLMLANAYGTFRFVVYGFKYHGQWQDARRYALNS
jgi:hypothetical protein